MIATTKALETEMSFMLKKKKYKFQVNLELREISAVPFVNGILFAKVRLLDGGSFVDMSNRQEVKNNCVKWDSQFKFRCKMTANASTGVLESCIFRISVRKEMRGGKSFEKLGFANVNLAEFAGAGLKSKRYLLEGYDAKHRQDNSMLHVMLEMFLLEGDPCFKTPVSSKSVDPLQEAKHDIQLPLVTKKEDQSGDSLASGSSGFGSLTRKPRPSVLCSDLVIGEAISSEKEGKEEELKLSDFERGHSRNSSYTSQHSKGSGYSSQASHSRQSSAESGHQRNLSSSSTYSENVLAGMPKVVDRKRPSKKQVSEDNRMDSTRVNAKEVINEVFEATNLDTDDTIEAIGLDIASFINKDGTPTNGNHKTLPSEFSSSQSFEQVVTHR